MTGQFIEGGGDPAGLVLPARDWDRLADYVGGALAGTPAEAEIARRVAEEPAWHRAHAALAEASAEVSAELAAWGRTPAPMPEDVAERLSAALATAGPAASLETSAPPRLSESGRRGGLSLVPQLSDDPDERPRPAAAKAARRWVRWARPVAVAASVLVVFGFGASALLPRLNSGDTAGTTQGRSAPGFGAQEDAAPAGGAPLAGGSPAQRVVASGIDYRRQTVLDDARKARARWSTATSAPVPQDYSAPPKSPNSLAGAPEALDSVVNPALRRLTATAALADCLRAIQAQHQRSAAQVELVDYARFEGSAALVVVFTDVSGERLVWASGPNCGLPGSGADTLHSARVG